MWEIGGMSDTISETGHLHRPDNTRIFFRTRRPTDPARASALVIVLHGVAEHSGRYQHVIDHLAEAGFAVFAPDHRGHGESSGTRVFVQRFREYTDDVQALIAHAQSIVPGRKVVLLGHSMGGLVAIQHLIDHAGVAELAVLTGPGLGIAVPVPKWKDALGRVMSKVWPTLAIPTGIGPELVSRDPAVVKAYAEDPKVTKKATARWYTEFLDAQARAFERAPGLKVPLLVLTGGKDQLVSVAAQEKWFEAVGSQDKTHIPYPALFHEVMNEPEKAAVLGDITRWLEARVAGVASARTG